MPGPCNRKKIRKINAKKEKKARARQSLDTSRHSDTPPLPSPRPTSESELAEQAEENTSFDGLVPQTPSIHDPGNGPRVRNTRAFLSSFFAQPPSLDDPLCAEFAQEEVLQMLCTVLPEETALILWYNKSRSTGRICPACHRLYKLGDVLPDHMDDDYSRTDNHPPQLGREQELSGLCSPVCFILASFYCPGAIKLSWGHTAEEIDDETWDLLNAPGDVTRGDLGLGLLLRMTRLDDLGLGQLCLPDMDL